MSLKVQLTGTAPGYGRLSIFGLPPSASSWEIEIQRNLDDKYLGPSRRWQSTPFRHRLSMVVVQDGGIEASVGPEIVDAIVAASNLAFMVSARTGTVEGKGVLRVIGRVLGSGAAGTGGDFPKATEEQPALMAQPEESTVVLEERLPLAEAPQFEQPTETVDDPASTGTTKYVILASILLLLMGTAFAAWYLGLFSKGNPQSGSEPRADSGVPQLTAAPKAVTAEARSLVGRARASAFLNQDPRPQPQAMLDQATEWKQGGDCEAAMIVYANAARVDAEAAWYLAQRYDPESFSQDPCIERPDAETASYWYEKPAREGNPVAQRRLGKILIRQYASGPLFEQGLGWLKKAAGAGDKEAEDALAQMGPQSSID